MYSWEITETLKNNNNEINSETYIKIIHKSLQINHVKYNAYSDSFEMWDKDGMYWNFRVNRKVE